MKGVLLAGGEGTRMHPLTRGATKHLMPVFDKPMIYYPLSTLMLLGIRDILVITRPEDQEQVSRLLGGGERFGLSLTYAVQPRPGGLPQAYQVGRDFVGGEDSALILGDNLFLGSGLGPDYTQRFSREHGARILAHEVSRPSAFGVVEIGEAGRVRSLEEKPSRPSSSLAVPGLYMFDDTVCERTEGLRPSDRGELEIIDLLRSYLEDECLQVEQLPRGAVWLDAGTIDALHEATSYVRAAQELQRRLLGSPEEIAWRLQYISADELAQQASTMGTSEYGVKLLRLIDAPRPSGSVTDSVGLVDA